MNLFSSNPPSSIHHLLIIDNNISQTLSQGDLSTRVNKSLDTIRDLHQSNESEQHRITIMIIEDGLIKCKCHDLLISKVSRFNHPIQHRSHSQGLYDGIGRSIAIWRALSHIRGLASSHNVSIYSNIRDKGSKKYNACMIKSVIKSLTQDGWTFTLNSNGSLLPQYASDLGIHQYNVCRPPVSTKERDFILAQLKRQWRLQQVCKPHNDTNTLAA